MFDGAVRAMKQINGTFMSEALRRRPPPPAGSSRRHGASGSGGRVLVTEQKFPWAVLQLPPLLKRLQAGGVLRRIVPRTLLSVLLHHAVHDGFEVEIYQ
ncbi:hypothetical protein EJB05_23577, partial [Eragrostis curvula]